MLDEVFGNSKRGIRIIWAYRRAKKEKSASLDDNKMYCELGSTRVFDGKNIIAVEVIMINVNIKEY